MFRDVEAVIFDLDGSLVDSMWIWRDIDIEYLGRYGIVLPNELQSEIEGMSFSETACYFKERFQIPDEIEKIKADWNEMAFDKYTHQVPLKKGAGSFLKECRKRGIHLAIATSNSRQLVTSVTQVHGIFDYFDGIVTGCDVAKGKPAPDVYLEAARICGVLPEHCMVFEDIVPGIQAGKAAGMSVCAVQDDYSMHQEKEKRLLADFYIKDYEELLKQLEETNWK